MVEITLTSQSEESLDTFESAVKECSGIMERHLMSGDADYLLRVVAADTADHERVHKILGRFPLLLTQLTRITRTHPAAILCLKLGAGADRRR